jgi:NADH-quinone oxidoreductase subunit N
LSLAGIPLTAGFYPSLYGKAATDRKYLGLFFAVLMAVVSVFYYFRVIQAMYFKDGDGQVIEVTPAFKITLLVIAALIIILGIFPNLIINWLYFN